MQFFYGLLVGIYIGTFCQILIAFVREPAKVPLHTVVIAALIWPVLEAHMLITAISKQLKLTRRE